MLTFNCLGITAEFGLNFVTHPEDKFVELQYLNDDADYISATYEEMSATLVDTLGDPDECFEDHLRWFDRRVVIDCEVSQARRRPDASEWHSYHKLSICNSFALPNHWNNCHR